MLASAGTVIGAVLVLMLLGKVSAGWAWRVRYTLTLLAPATVTAAGLLIIISDSPVRPATPAVAVFYWLLGSALVAQLLFRPIWSLSTRGADPETPGRQFRDRVEAATLYLTAAAGAGAVVAAVPLLWDGYAALSASIDLSWPTAGIALAATLVSAVIAKWLLSDEALETLIGAALTAAPLLFFLLLFLAASISFSSATPAAVVALVVVVPPFLWYFMDLNALSLHGFYRRQLAKCYLIRQAAGSEMKEVGKLRLSALGSRAPYHLVNATVNLPGSGNKGLRGRKGDFFLFSKRHCGSPTTGYVRTETLEDLDPALDLGSAMAISGAAFSSNMAVLELDHLRFFLTLLNVRLGYWIPNAENLGWIVETARKLFRGHRCTPGPGFLRHEMFGTMDESHSFLNLSDGGHIENLGVYELLRRKCKFVIAVDGECDETRVFDAVVKLTRYARIDLGAEVTVDLRELTVDDNGLSRSHAALGKITYADQSIGWLLYLKPSLTGNEPLDLLDYRREQPAFPHESTLDQLYSEKQFEAYRALGEHTANELFRSDILRPKGRDFEAHSSRGNTDINKWYEALAMNMLPDNDEVFKADPTNLTDLRVNIAISRSDKADLEEINRVTTEFCEKLISLGATVVLGHDWRKDGIMAHLYEFADQDRKLYDRGGKPAILNRVLAGFDMPGADLELGDLISLRPVIGDLNDLRVALTDESDARICLGGKTREKDPLTDPRGYEGVVPGVAEEAWLAAQQGKPVLISGCLGGVSEWMASELLGREPQAPDYDGEGAMERGLPGSAADLIVDLQTHFKALHDDEQELHERLWKTTDLDAALAICLEILDQFWAKRFDQTT